MDALLRRQPQQAQSADFQVRLQILSIQPAQLVPRLDGYRQQVKLHAAKAKATWAREAVNSGAETPRILLKALVSMLAMIGKDMVLHAFHGKLNTTSSTAAAIDASDRPTRRTPGCQPS